MTDDRTAIGDALEHRAGGRHTDGMTRRTGRRPSRAWPTPSTVSAATASPPPRSAWQPGEEARDIEYTEAETETWVTCGRRCGALHVDLACRAYLDGAERLALPTDAVPQLAEVSRRLRRLTGWRVTPRRGWRRSASSTAPSPSGASCRRSTCATRRCRCTRPSPTSSTSSSATPTGSPSRGSPTCTRSPAPRAPAGAPTTSRAAAVLADVLVHARVRRRPRGRRAQGVRRRAAVELRGDPGVPQGRDPRRRPRRDGAHGRTTSTCTSRCCSPRPLRQRSSTTSQTGSTPSPADRGPTAACASTTRPARDRGQHRYASVPTVASPHG